MRAILSSPEFVPTRPYHIEIMNDWRPLRDYTQKISTSINHYVSYRNNTTISIVLFILSAIYQFKYRTNTDKCRQSRVPNSSRLCLNEVSVSENESVKRTRSFSLSSYRTFFQKLKTNLDVPWGFYVEAIH